MVVVVAVLALPACTRTLQSTASRPCPPPSAQAKANGIGIIGMSLDQLQSSGDTPELVVDRVVPDGPAAIAGIRAGDRILAIEGTPTQGMSIADAARRLRGPIDASVALVIATGSRPRDVTITRVAPSDLWNGHAGSPGKHAERVHASDVAPAAQLSAPPCRQ